MSFALGEADGPGGAGVGCGGHEFDDVLREGGLGGGEAEEGGGFEEVDEVGEAADGRAGLIPEGE